MVYLRRRANPTVYITENVREQILKKSLCILTTLGGPPMIYGILQKKCIIAFYILCCEWYICPSKIRHSFTGYIPNLDGSSLGDREKISKRMPQWYMSIIPPIKRLRQEDAINLRTAEIHRKHEHIQSL